VTVARALVWNRFFGAFLRQFLMRRIEKYNNCLHSCVRRQMILPSTYYQKRLIITVLTLPYIQILKNVHYKSL